MSVKVVSNVQKIESSIDKVYHFLSDLNKVGAMIDMARQMGMAKGEMANISDKVNNFQTTEDTCTFDVKDVGKMGVRIVEKLEPKLVKYGSEGGVPFEFTMWIQLLENGPYDTRMRITFETEMNMVMKMMLKGKLEKGINQLAEGLAKLPYAFLP